MRYHFMTVDRDGVNAALTRMTDDGWSVHTINRNMNASVVDILFERAK